MCECCHVCAQTICISRVAQTATMFLSQHDPPNEWAVEQTVPKRGRGLLVSALLPSTRVTAKNCLQMFAHLLT